MIQGHMSLTKMKEQAARYTFSRLARKDAEQYLDEYTQPAHYVYKIRRIGGHIGKGKVVPVYFIIEYRLYNEAGPTVGYLEVTSPFEPYTNV